MEHEIVQLSWLCTPGHYYDISIVWGTYVGSFVIMAVSRHADGEDVHPPYSNYVVSLEPR